MSSKPSPASLIQKYAKQGDRIEIHLRSGGTITGRLDMIDDYHVVLMTPGGRSFVLTEQIGGAACVSEPDNVEDDESSIRAVDGVGSRDRDVGESGAVSTDSFNHGSDELLTSLNVMESVEALRESLQSNQDQNHPPSDPKSESNQEGEEAEGAPPSDLSRLYDKLLEGSREVAPIVDRLVAKFDDQPQGIKADPNVRYGLIQAYKVIEHHRDRAVASEKKLPSLPTADLENAQSSASLLLSQALYQINEALRSVDDLPPEERFIDLYHYFVAIRANSDNFLQARGRQLARKLLKESYDLAGTILNDQVIQAGWRSTPQRRSTFFHRYGQLHRHEADWFTNDPSRKFKLLEKADELELMSGRARSRPLRKPITPKGTIKSFGRMRFGFIESANGRTFYFKVSNVADPLILQSLHDSRAFEALEVDFESRPSSSGQYPVADLVREPGSAVAKITRIDPSGGYLFLTPIAGLSTERIYVRIQDWPEGEPPPELNMEVVCVPELGSKGHCSSLIRIRPSPQSANSATEREPDTGSTDVYRLLGEAQALREIGDYDAARAIYEKAMVECAVPQVALSYAAMMRERQDRAGAMLIYERALKVHPKDGKLLEDAGVNAMQLNRLEEARIYLESALQASRVHPTKSGLRNRLLLLGRLNYEIGQPASLEAAIAYYEEAEREFGGEDEMRRRLPKQHLEDYDATRAQLAKIRSKSVKGEHAFQFLEKAGMEIVAARTRQSDRVAHVICRLHEDVVKDFDIGPHILVLILLDDSVPRFEEKLQTAWRQSIEAYDCDPGICLAVLPSLPSHKKGQYRISATEGRIVVPISQAELLGSSAPTEVLRKLIAQWLYSRDLFSANSLVTGEQFFGRKPVLADLQDAITLGEPIAVLGLRKMGKTSVLAALSDRLTSADNLVIYADVLVGFGRSSRLAWLYGELQRHLREEFASKVSPELGTLPFGRVGSNQESDISALADRFFGDLTEALAILRQIPQDQRPKIIVIIDEVEWVLRDTEPGGFELLGGLRGLNQSNQDVFSYIVSAANPKFLEQPRIGKGKERIDNPVFNSIRPIFLPHFDFGETRDMVVTLGRKMGISFEDSAIKELQRMTGGHPFVSRLICSLATRELNDIRRRIDTKRVEDACRMFLQDYGEKALKEIQTRLQEDFHDEFRLFKELINSGGEAPASDGVNSLYARIRGASNLQNYGLVVFSEHRVRVRMALWMEVL